MPLWKRFVSTLYRACLGIDPQLDAVMPLCESDVEKVRVATLLVRQFIAANRHAEALTRLWATLREQGYDPVDPAKIKIRVPESVEDVIELGEELKDEEGAQDDVRSLIISLLGNSSPLARADYAHKQRSPAPPSLSPNRRYESLRLR